MTRRTILSDYNNQEMMRDLIDDINDYIGEKPIMKTNDFNPSIPEPPNSISVDTPSREALMSDIAKSLDPLDFERPLLVESDSEDEDEDVHDEGFDHKRNGHSNMKGNVANNKAYPKLEEEDKDKADFNDEEQEQEEDDDEEEERYAHRRFPSRLPPPTASSARSNSVERPSVNICHKCKKEEPVKPKPSNSLRPEYTCKDCKKGSRRRSLSATGLRILEFAGRVKQTLLAPIKTIERRRSMPSIEVYTKDGKDLLHKSIPSPITPTGNYTIPIVDRRSLISPRQEDKPTTFYSEPEQTTNKRPEGRKETNQGWTPRNRRPSEKLKYNSEVQSSFQYQEQEQWPDTATATVTETNGRISSPLEYPSEEVEDQNQEEYKEEEEEEVYYQDQEQDRLNQYSDDEYYDNPGDYNGSPYQDQEYIMVGAPSEMVYSASPSGTQTCLTPANRNGGEHTPLRTMDLDELNSRIDRIIAYEHAYYSCIAAKTYLTPWVKKQYSKGPPDAMFDYTPPPKRSTSRIFGLFKRSSSRNLSQSNVGDLSNPLTKSMLSLSSHISSSQIPISTITTSQPNCLIEDQRRTSTLDFLSGDEDFDEGDNSLQIVKPKKSGLSLRSSSISPSRESNYSRTSISSISPMEEPVSILKKKPSQSKVYQTPSTRSSTFFDPSREVYDEDPVLDNPYESIYEPQIPPQRRSSYISAAPSYHSSPLDDRHSMIDHDNFQEPYSASKRRVKSTPPVKQYTSRPLPYTESSPVPFPTRSSKYVSAVSSSTSLHRDYQSPQGWTPTRSPSFQSSYDYSHKPAYNEQSSYSYHSHRPTPEPVYEPQHYQHTPAARAAHAAQFSYDAWDKALDDLCAFFRHVDRSILEEYLEEAQGDFHTAKRMCIDTIMTSGL
ncbi:hypothetical protein F4703DRAFT_1937932 [Phycomyces blakesleeanus]